MEVRIFTLHNSTKLESDTLHFNSNMIKESKFVFLNIAFILSIILYIL